MIFLLLWASLCRRCAFVSGSAGGHRSPELQEDPLAITPRPHPAVTGMEATRQFLSEHKHYGRAAKVFRVL